MNKDVNLEVESEFEYVTAYYNKGFLRDGETKKVINDIVEDESNKSFAKSVYNVTNNTYRYFIKAENKKILNPYDGSLRRRIMGRSIAWMKVSKAAFEHYTRFLRTQNNQFLHYAEREI